MSSLLLSPEERNRFADWLKQDVESDKLMIEQLSKLGPPGELMAKKMKLEVAAGIVVLQKLLTVEGPQGETR